MKRRKDFKLKSSAGFLLTFVTAFTFCSLASASFGGGPAYLTREADPDGEAGGISFKAPEAWLQEEPDSAMRLFQYRIPPAGDAGPAELAVFDRISHAARFRRFGTDCYGYGLLAAGLADAVMESDLKPYDYCALVPVIEGAGGVITDWQGRTLSLESDGRVLASASPEIHKELLLRLAG